MMSLHTSNQRIRTRAARARRPPRHQGLAPARHTLQAGLGGLKRIAARMLRFAGVGGVCGALQIGLLVALTRPGVGALVANVTAYLLSAQVNFVLSDAFIWGDRRLRRTGKTLARRWASFHLGIAGTFVLSQAVFVAARAVLGDVAASAAGIGLAALINFAIQDRLTFSGDTGGGPVGRAVAPGSHGMGATCSNGKSEGGRG